MESKKDREVLGDWLLSYAVGLEYSDRADALQKIVEPPQKKSAPTPGPTNRSPASAAHTTPAARQAGEVQIDLDVDTPDFRQALEELADILGLPHNDSSEAMVRACAAVLDQKLSAAARQRADTAAAAAAAVAAAAAGTGKRRLAGQQSVRVPRTFNLQDFPPGFDTGDMELNKAAALLRLLYVSDLRRLQDEINSLIASMQE